MAMTDVLRVSPQPDVHGMRDACCDEYGQCERTTFSNAGLSHGSFEATRHFRRRNVHSGVPSHPPLNAHGP